MPTPVDICNLALDRLGAKRIAALTDTSTEGKLCALHYPLVRDTLVRGHPWTFLKTVVDIGATDRTVSTLDSSWEYAFTLPTASAAIARVLAVTDLSDYLIDYEYVDGKFHCNEESIRLRYIKRYTAASPTNPDTSIDYPSDFSDILAWLLAADLCVPLTQNQSLRATFLGQAQFALSQARNTNAIEQPPQDGVAEDWIRARDGGRNRHADPDHRQLNP